MAIDPEHGLLSLTAKLRSTEPKRSFLYKRHLPMSYVHSPKNLVRPPVPPKIFIYDIDLTIHMHERILIHYYLVNIN